ncbi:MAG: glycerophosphodiester phosphodiesterase family protein [Pseudomonadota bacterium]
MSVPKGAAGADIPVIAHRGYAAQYPENTMVALQSAFRCGAHRIEFDLQLTADKVPVLLHDVSLERTGADPRSIFELTSAQATTTAVGHASKLGDGFASECIPTLRAAVDWIRSEPAVVPYVEIKRESADQFGVDTVVDAVARELHPIRERAVVISFDPRCLSAARDAGHSRLGFCARALDRRNESVARGLSPEVILLDHRSFPDDGTSQLWPGEWQWAVYEIVEPEQAHRLRERGIDFIETMAVETLVSAFSGGH